MSKLSLAIGTVREVENVHSPYIKDNSVKHENDRPFDGLRVRVELDEDTTVFKEKGYDTKYLQWAFPLLPKMFQSIPSEGEAVLVIYDREYNGQRYYIGPLISQPQYNTYCKRSNGVSLIKTRKSTDNSPLERASNNPNTDGSFPNSSDVAVVGRGSEDIILRYDKKTKSSEVNLRAGIRNEPTNDPNPNMIGNIIFNDVDPAYIQLKYKKGLSSKSGQSANSLINVVADRINLISNMDSVATMYMHDKSDLMPNGNADYVMEALHQVPKGDKLVELLYLIKGALLSHVHAWAGLPQCGDWSGYIDKLNKFTIEDILSEYVRIS